MKNYDHITNVLANYFSTDIGHSEEEAIYHLLQNSSKEFLDNLRNEIQDALADPSCSWRDLLSEFNVVSIENEQAARAYARKILSDHL